MLLTKYRSSYGSGNLDKQNFIESMYQVHSELYDYFSLISNKSVDISNIEISQKGVIYTVASTGIKFLTSICDKRNAPLEIINFNKYEESESELMIKVCDFLRDDFTFVDVGANVGWYSTMLSKRYSNSRVFSFEPITPVFEQLKKNIELNELNNCYAFNLGLSDEKGELKFYFDENFSGKTSLAKTAENGVIEVSAKLDTLDQYSLEVESLDKIDLIKCDIEGAEIKFVHGALKSIDNYRPVVFMELLRKWCAKFNYHPNDVIDIFRSVGYQCYGISDNGLREIDVVNLDTIETNYIFLHKVNHINIIEELVS